MRFSVTHATRYTYDRPVFIEPMTFRLRPQTNLVQRADSFSLTIDPAPAGMAEFDDAEGNTITRAWFNGTTDTLQVRSAFEVETLRSNPFDFILVDPRAGRLPMRYETATADALARYGQPTGTVHDFAADLIDTSEGDAPAFLRALNARLHAFDYEIREQGDAWPPAETLARGGGSCRDLTVLFMDTCRNAGLAARFVSGYQRAGDERGPRYMHAWAEVYLDGAGWRGYDPSLGLAVADGHVAVATAPHPAGAAPTSGTFRGTDTREAMHADIEIVTAP